MNVKLVSLASVLIALFLLAPLANAGTTVYLHPSSALDRTGGLNGQLSYTLNPGDLSRLGASDNSRFTTGSKITHGNWGWALWYNNEEFLWDFTGSNIPSNALVKTATLNLEHNRNKLSHEYWPYWPVFSNGARVRVWNGASWSTAANDLMPLHGDGPDSIYSINVYSWLNSPSSVNSALLRFQAYGKRFIFGPKTRHNLVELQVYYNIAPIAGNASITPNPAYTTDSLTANYDYYDGDGDAETGSIIDWYVNSVKVHTGATLDSTLFVKGDSVYFVITPFDGEDYGVTVTSSSITIQNTPPVITLTSPNGGEIWSGVHAVTWTASDADGDTLSIDLEYNVLGNAWRSIATGIMHTGINGTEDWNTTTSYYAEDDDYLVRAIADDGSTTTSDESDAYFMVDNLAPVTTMNWVSTASRHYNDGTVDWYNAVGTAELTPTDLPAGFNYMYCSVANIALTDCSGSSNPNNVNINFEGVSLLTWHSQDNADAANVEAPQSVSIGIDTTDPSAPSSITAPRWTNNPTFTVYWDQAFDGGSGVCSYNVYVNSTLNGTNNDAECITNGSCSYTITGKDFEEYIIGVTAVDCVGNEGPANSTIVGVDTTKPPSTFLWRLGPWFRNYDSVQLFWTSAEDGFSGIKDYDLFRGNTEFQGSVPFSTMASIVTADTSNYCGATPSGYLCYYTDSSAKTDDQKYVYLVEAEDNAGNTNKSNRARTIYDVSAPVTSASLSGTIGENDWYTSSVQVSLESWDKTSGTVRMRCRVNGAADFNCKYTNGKWDEISNATGGSSINTEGNFVFEFMSRDRAINWEAWKSTTFKIDLTKPSQPENLTATGLSNPGLQLTNDVNYVLEWDAVNDSVSGTWYYTVYRDGSAIGNSSTKEYSETAPGEGTYCYEITQTDYAGHESAESTQYCVTVDLTPPNMTGAITRTYTTIDVFFDEDLEGSQVKPYDFVVEDNTVTGVTEFNGTVTLTLSTAMGGDDTPWVAIVQTPKCVMDLAGNIQGTGNVTAADGIAPAFVSITPDKAYYVPEDLITLTVVMDLPGYSLRADFSAIDSEFVNGSENVTANGSTYTITYALNASNTRGGSLATGYDAIVYAQDAALNEASDSATLYYDVSTIGELTLVYSVEGNYDIAVGGIGLRPNPADRNLTLNAPGAITKAFLYWQTMGTPTASDANITIDGTEVTGITIGNSWLTLGDNDHNRTTFRADVTALVVQGSHAYVITGETGNVEGAGLVIVYQTTGPNAFIQINDGCGNPRLNVSTEFTGFTAWSGYTADLWIIGGGSSTTANIASYFNEALLSTNSWNNSDGNEWDTDYFEVTALVNESDSSATARVYGYNSESFKWAAAIIKVTGEEPAKATPNSGGGGVNSHDVYLPAESSYQPPEEPAPVEEPNEEPLHLQAPSYARVGNTVEVLATDEDGNPLAGATVYLNAGGYYTTDENGVISFVAKEEGWTEYTAYKAGYYQAEDAKSYFRKAAFYDIGSIPEVEGETIVEPLTPGPATGLFTAANAPWLGVLVLILLGGGYYTWRTRLAG